MKISFTKWQFLSVVLLSILLSSCNSHYNQYYENYYDFNKANQRNKGWFPYQLISPRTYNLISRSSLQHNYAFGSFRYNDSLYYDSLFEKSNIEHITFTTFLEKVRLNERGRPSSFIDSALVSKKQSENIKYERFYITRNKASQTIYFVLSH